MRWYIFLMIFLIVASVFGFVGYTYGKKKAAKANGGNENSANPDESTGG